MPNKKKTPPTLPTVDQAVIAETAHRILLAKCAFWMIMPLGIVMILATFWLFAFDVGSCYVQWGMCGVDGIIGWSFKRIVKYLFPSQK